MTTLFPEILTKIFKYFEDDYKTLFSCALVNKQWHIFSIPSLWRDPFYSISTVKILIRCLFVGEEENFFEENGIKLKFELSRKQTLPLYNYAKFATNINYNEIFTLCNSLILNNNNNSHILANNIIKLILKHSEIRQFINFQFGETNCESLVNNYNFDDCFYNLHKLGINFSGHHKFINKLSCASKNIKSITIYLNSDKNNNDGLAELISAQKKIKELVLYGCCDLTSSNDFKEAISIHSKSITFYESHGRNNLDSILIPTFLNLKNLKLKSCNHYCYSTLVNLKTSLPPKIEALSLDFGNRSFLLDLSGFIKNNGRILKTLDIGGEPNDVGYLKELLQSISINCRNLEYLTTLYKNEFDQQLNEIFNKCEKIKYIKFIAPNTNTNWKYMYDGDRIIKILNQVLPKKLEYIEFDQKVVVSEKETLDLLIKSWKGPKLLTIKLLGIDDDFVLEMNKVNGKFLKIINVKEDDFMFTIIEINIF